jgi:hypothetical protein
VLVLLKCDVAQIDFTLRAGLGEYCQHKHLCFDMRNIGPTKPNVVRLADWALKSIVVKGEYFRWVDAAIEKGKKDGNDADNQVDVPETALLYDALHDIHGSDKGKETPLKQSHPWSSWFGLKIKSNLFHWLFGELICSRYFGESEASKPIQLAPQTALSLGMLNFIFLLLPRDAHGNQRGSSFSFPVSSVGYSDVLWRLLW